MTVRRNFDAGRILTYGKEGDSAAQARNLFSGLRELDGDARGYICAYAQGDQGVYLPLPTGFEYAASM